MSKQKKKRFFPIRRTKKQDDKSESGEANRFFGEVSRNSGINHQPTDNMQTNVVIGSEDLAQLKKSVSQLFRDVRVLDRRVQEIQRKASSSAGKAEYLQHRQIIRLLFLIAPFIGLLIGYAIYFFILKGG